ncbi:hypothetical protein AN641_03605 [Candidatus Epulonipiscioides gigas]|nr:hypothetical protein AN641_03605 [Epulopiscium sp. SCG-C07WGA-EpuloA2]
MNPILSGFYPDPSICRVDDTFYMVTSSFEFFPSVPIFKSKNLVNWEQIGYCVTNEHYLKLRTCRNSGGIFAPTIRYNNGTFYMITTDVGGIGNFIVTATNPEGPWSEPIRVDFQGIDPSLYFEDDDVYCNSTGKDEHGTSGIVMAKIDIKTGECLEDKKFLWSGTGGTFPEGAHIYKRGTKYFLLIAEGGTSMGHMVTVASADNIYGPYESNPNNPILTHRDQARTEIQGLGHMDIVEDQNGNFWAVFLGFRLTESYFHHLGRETFLAPVTWKENEFPVINDNQPITRDISLYKLPQELTIINKSFIDNFSTNTLNFRYNFLRRPVKYELDNGLILYGNDISLNECGTPSFIGFRQTEFNIEVFFHVKYQIQENDICGITVFYDNTRHFDLCLASDNIFVRKIFDDMKDIIVSDNPVFNNRDNFNEAILYIKSDTNKYYFGYGKTPEEAKNNILATGLTRHVSTEISKISFTGVYLGMFVEGSSESKMIVNEIQYNVEEQE